jgi:hypothetical protein
MTPTCAVQWHPVEKVNINIPKPGQAKLMPPLSTNPGPENRDSKLGQDLAVRRNCSAVVKA